MRNILLAILTLVTLAGCSNTRYGIQQDARRMGEKTQAIGQILSTP